MNLTEAMQKHSDCDEFGTMCEDCPLGTFEYFKLDPISGVEFGIKASICELLNLVEYLLKQRGGIK